MKFNKANEHPYVVKWDTNPPSQTEVKEADVMGLLQNYKWCRGKGTIMAVFAGGS